MINFETWLEQVEHLYGAKIVDWMLPFAKIMFDSNVRPEDASDELHPVWSDHNQD